MLVITQLQPINVIFAVAEDYLPQIERPLRHGGRLLVDAFDRAQQKKLATDVGVLAVLAYNNWSDGDRDGSELALTARFVVPVILLLLPVVRKWFWIPVREGNGVK